MFKHFFKNKKGFDYVVGDIHGCFTKLQERLDEVGFNPKTDRLFSVGDLVDRGTESKDCLDWLEQPWFNAVRGNHEQMAIDASQGYFDRNNYIYNGGGWFLSLTQSMKDLYAEKFLELPIAIEVETDDGSVGIIHAECPVHDWEELKVELDKPNDYFVQNCMWSRDRIHLNITTEVKNISKVIVGHTPLKEIANLGNVMYIDTGVVFTGNLTIVKL